MSRFCQKVYHRDSQAYPRFKWCYIQSVYISTISHLININGQYARKIQKSKINAYNRLSRAISSYRGKMLMCVLCGWQWRTLFWSVDIHMCYMYLIVSDVIIFFISERIFYTFYYVYLRGLMIPHRQSNRLYLQ